LIVANAADAQVVSVVDAHARAQVAWFALEGEDTHGKPPHWLAAPAQMDEAGTRFDLYAGGVACGRMALTVPGRHNLKNALAAIGATAQGYGARIADIVPALARFEGVRRRQDLIGTPRESFVYDDFAHHPTAVQETLAALRGRHPAAKLFAVFEPRSATACRRMHQAEYTRAFAAADEVLLAPLGRSNLAADEALDLTLLASDLNARGKAAQALPSVDAIVDYLALHVAPGSVVALLSNGAFGGIHAKLLDRLAR
jgi:UDP-N-acetylmuramate: L-alanyl-gamma-D-glutamyl-meso-diaminopimelate ligase